MNSYRTERETALFNSNEVMVVVVDEEPGEADVSGQEPLLWADEGGRADILDSPFDDRLLVGLPREIALQPVAEHTTLVCSPYVKTKAATYELLASGRGA